MMSKKEGIPTIGGAILAVLLMALVVFLVQDRVGFKLDARFSKLPFDSSESRQCSAGQDLLVAISCNAKEH